MKLTIDDINRTIDRLKNCNNSKYLRTEIYGLHDEKETLEYWIDKFKNDNSVMLLDAKTGDIFYCGKLFNKRCKSFEN